MFFLTKMIQGSFLVFLVLLLVYVFFREEATIQNLEHQFYEWISSAQEPITLEKNVSALRKQAQQADYPSLAIAFLHDASNLVKKSSVQTTSSMVSSLLIAELNVEIGTQYNRLGRYDQAQESLQEALDKYRKLEHLKGQGEALTELGILSQHLAQFDHALEAFQAALAFHIQLKQQDRQAKVLTHLGTIYSYQNQDQQATERFEQALDLYRKLQKTDGISEVMSQQGNLHHRRQRYPEALKMFEEALSIAKTPLEQANLLLQEGMTYLEMSQFDKAIAVLERAEFFFDSSQSKDLVKKIQTLIQRGRVEVAQQHDEEALKYFMKAFHLSQDIQYRQGEWESLIHLGLTYDQLKRYDEALAKFIQALAVDAKDGKVFAQDRLKNYDEIIQLLETYPTDEAQTLNIFESRQKRVLLSFVGKPFANFSPDLLQEENKLTQRLETLEDQLAKAYAQQPVRSDLIQQLTSQLKQWQGTQLNFEKLLFDKAPNDYFLRYAQPVNLKSLQSQLSPHEAMLIYHVMENETLLWAIHRDQVMKEKLSSGRKKPSRQHMSHDPVMKEKLSRQQVQVEKSTKLISYRLSSKKLGPWLEKLKPQTLYLVPTRALCYTPFLGSINYPLTYLPSASALEYLRIRASLPHKSCQDILAYHEVAIPSQVSVSDLSSTSCLIEVTSNPSQVELPVCLLAATLLYAGVSTVSVKPWSPAPPSLKKGQTQATPPPITFGIQ